MEDITEIKKIIKKCESNIVISGTWFVLFGLWSVLKLVISMIYSEDGIRKILGEMEFDTEFDKVVIVLGFIIFAIIILTVHAYIGMKAISYGRGRKRRKFFLFVAGGVLALTVWGIPSYFKDCQEGHVISMIDDTKIAAMLVDLVVLYILLDMIISVIRLGIYNRKLREKEA